MSLLDSVLSAENSNGEYNVAVLKKAQDAQKQQAEAMVNLLENAGPSDTGRHLDTYA